MISKEARDKALRDAHIDMVLNRLEGRLSALERAGAVDKTANPAQKDPWMSLRQACMRQADEELRAHTPSPDKIAQLVAIAIAIDAHVNDLSAGAAERFVDLVLAGKA